MTNISTGLLANVETPIVDWALDYLICPNCKDNLSINEDNDFTCASCGKVGRYEEGVAKFILPKKDISIEWYKAKGGTEFIERTKIPYTMSSLDAPVYQSILEAYRPKGKKVAIADIGSGDGRNTIPWLEWGYERVIALDPVSESLIKLRHVLHDDWHDRVLFIEADSRAMPLKSNSIDFLIAIEALACLNEDYSVGLKDCVRILAKGKDMLISERAWEGCILMQLLYGGVEAMTKMKTSQYVWDGPTKKLNRNRVFKEGELVEMLKQNDLTIEKVRGISLLSILLGYLRGQSKLRKEDEMLLPEVLSLLKMLTEEGSARRAHVIKAKK